MWGHIGISLGCLRFRFGRNETTLFFLHLGEHGSFFLVL